jgi:type I restriction enzyme M protein
VLVPEGLLFGSTTAHVELRRKLVENYDLQAVISLPAGVFKPYAGVKTGVLVFRRPAGEKKEKRSGKVLFAEIKNDGFDTDKITGGGRPETPEKNDIPELLRLWKLFRESGFQKPPGVKAGTLLPPGSAAPTCWWATLNEIAATDFNLAAGRYKPQVSEKPPEENPAELISATLKLEREIATGLEKLLNEVEAVK